MVKNLKYQWCEPNALNDKEFLGWIYDRLHIIYGDKASDPYIQRLDKIIDDMKGTIPDGPKQRICIDITDNNLVIIKRHGKVILEE